ncbi:MAG TPA: hypothetical protein VGG75_21585 [Trebonia sp.]|jgi:hypothetical protein
MGMRFITVVALHGAKDDPFKTTLATVREIVHREVGDEFQPYSLKQIHGTLVGLDAFINRHSGTLVHKHYYEVTGSTQAMAPGRALEIICSSLRVPMRIRIGGHRATDVAKFSSRGEHPYERMFSFRNRAFVLIGWPVSTITAGASDKPLDDLRRRMNDANIMHLYHETGNDIDNDLHFVIGHLKDSACAGSSNAVSAVRTYLSENPVEINVGVGQASVIVCQSPTLAPAEFRGPVTMEPEEIVRLFQLG